jgi:uncharacterized membrane protein
MDYGTPSFQIAVLAGFIFVLAGAFLWWKPPGKINSFYGYRTLRSMRSQANWDYAQTKGGREMVIAGAGMILLGGIVSFFPLSNTASTIAGLAILLMGTISPIWRTERALKNRD